MADKNFTHINLTEQKINGSRVLPRERVFEALAFHETDIRPYYIWVDEEMMEPLAQWYGVDDIKKQVIHDHTVMTEIKSLKHPIDKEYYQDDFGTLWRKVGYSIPHVEKPALATASIDGYSFPDLTTESHFESLSEWLDANWDRFKIVQLTELFWERTWPMRGMECIMMDMYDNPSFVDALLDKLETTCMAVIERLLRDFGNKIDAIGFSDDMGGQQNMLISPEAWRRFIKPHQKRFYERIRSAGKVVYLHTCGHVEPIVGELIDIGVNMLQPIQPETMDIFTLKAKYGHHLCFAGGISTQHTLPYGTPDQVREETMRCIEVMGKGGGYVVAPASKTKVMSIFRF
jgi:uroporphyrinogen decarboxylase